MDKQTGPKGFLVVLPGEIIEIPQDSDKSWLTLFYSLPRELAEKWKPAYELPRCPYEVLWTDKYNHIVCDDMFKLLVWDCYPPTGLEVSEVLRTKTGSLATWYLYKIQIKRFSEITAKFFLKYAIFLTEHPTKFYPIWPAYIKEPYFIYHNSDQFFFYLDGDDAELRAYLNIMTG